MSHKGEDAIRKAIEDGLFNDLPGKGKRLDLSENPFEDPEWRLANKMLHDNGFTLPWIQDRQEIDSELDAARKALKSAWERRKRSQDENWYTRQVEEDWQKALDRFETKIAELNKRIFHYNLQAPSLAFQRLALNLEREIESVKTGTGE